MRKTLTIEQLLKAIKASTIKRMECVEIDKINPYLEKIIDEALQRTKATSEPLPQWIVKHVKNGKVDKETSLGLRYVKITVFMPGIGYIINTSIIQKSKKKHDYLWWLPNGIYMKEGIELRFGDNVEMEDEEGHEIDEEDVIDAIFSSNIFDVSKWA